MPVLSDKRRLDWLERQSVSVRTPLLYGSRERFIASPEDRDAEEDMPSDLRKRIDAAMVEDRKAKP